MLARMLLSLAVAALLHSGLRAQDNGKLPYDASFTLRLTGDVARAFSAAEGHRPGKNDAEIQIETSARIAQVLQDGRLRVEHSSLIKRSGQQDRLLTLSAIVSPSQFATHSTPKGSKVYASPASFKDGKQPRITNEDSAAYILTLSELKDMKIRVWTIEKEIAD